MQAPFIAICVIMPRFIKSMIIGFNPTFIGCAPIANVTVLPFFFANTTASTTSLKFFAERICGSELRRYFKPAPFLYGIANSFFFTLLFLDFNEYVFIFERSMAGSFFVICQRSPLQ